jgi:hypothetical protein
MATSIPSNLNPSIQYASQYMRLTLDISSERNELLNARALVGSMGSDPNKSKWVQKEKADLMDAFEARRAFVRAHKDHF